MLHTKKIKKKKFDNYEVWSTLTDSRNGKNIKNMQKIYRKASENS